MTEKTSHNSPPKASAAPRRWTGGRRWRGAFASRSVFSPLPFISSKSFAAHRIQPRSPGALRLFCPALGLRALRFRHRKKNHELTVTGPYAYTRNPLYLGSIAHRRRVRSGADELAAGDAARGRICRNLHSGHCVGGAISSRNISRVRRLLPHRAPIHPAPHTRQAPGEMANPPFPNQLPKRLRVAFRSPFTSSTASTILLLGAALLYLSLLFLRPALELFCTGWVSAFR